MQVHSEHVRRGIELFNSGSYFEAHEMLEDAWRESQGEHRQLLQGLVQAAVAMHHLRAGNLAGACGVMARALRNLQPYPDVCDGILVADLRAQLSATLESAERGESTYTAPQILTAVDSL